MKLIKLGILPTVLLTTLSIYAYNSQESANVATDRSRPDFAQIGDINEKKLTFFEYMLPMIRQANAATLAERKSVQSLQKQFAGNQKLDAADQKLLEDLLDTYHVDVDNEITQAHITELLNRCDIVPAALILAQSANESAWGTSRFAVKANNFFGLWCFQRGCGLTPKDRNDGASHEVAKFESVNHGVRFYIKTINTNNAYEDLREIRADLREDNKAITGTTLAEGLLRYSERGKAYVKEIQSMIRFNKLSRYNLNTQA
jgi:Bax protein